MSFSCRKRILATGGSGLSRIQLPDSTVISEPSSKENSYFSCDISNVMSSSCSQSLDSTKPSQIRRSSAISVDYHSDHSDRIINVNPMNNKIIRLENESVCDSPSARGLKNPSFDFSKKTGTDLNGSDLFFSPKRPESVIQNQSKTAGDADPDDFDDFDIDDLNDSDIPEYFDEPPSLPVLSQKNSTVTRTVKEGGPSTSSWDKKPATPASAPRPSKICSPGNNSETVPVKVSSGNLC